ncbi:hypothetical protein WJX81_008531 [Elliptochloris bilobata]|uniref:N-acetyltransferase domain-containing protein n=1 Tax=Elliptochloris bilobata TaxID=381761 RepID=A0AAW1RMM6_9CHLO
MWLAEFVRHTSPAVLEADQRYAALHVDETELGRLVVRPLHESHAYETALVLTEAFLIDNQPPEFSWMLAELQREARHYAVRPAPVTHGCVDIGEPWLDEPWRAQAGNAAAARADEERIRTESAWGRWLWLVAELEPHDPALRPVGQETRVLGATALLFHGRTAALAALAALRPPVSPAAMDFSLWLARQPPADLPHDRAAFLWWTGVDYRFRRRGVAQALIAACEAVALAAGFPDLYIQAATTARDPGSPLGGWLNQAYTAAEATYARAGYEAWRPPAPDLLHWDSVDRSAVLMHKHLFPLATRR